MQNQHVITYKNQIRLDLYKKLKTFRDPGGNLASPTRGMLYNAECELTKEVVSQISI